MCWWSVKVTVTVTGNLVLRVCAELTDAVCKLLVAWWCASSSTHGQKTSGTFKRSGGPGSPKTVTAVELKENVLNMVEEDRPVSSQQTVFLKIIKGHKSLKIPQGITHAIYAACLVNNLYMNENDLESIQFSPWFLNIDRMTSEKILQDQTFDGAFLIRPSSNPDNVCTLSVLQNDQPFHINVRQRPDGWLALGTCKPNEHCFATIQDIVEFYKKETLVINSCGDKYLTVLKEQTQMKELNNKEQDICYELPNQT